MIDNVIIIPVGPVLSHHTTYDSSIIIAVTGTRAITSYHHTGGTRAITSYHHTGGTRAITSYQTIMEFFGRHSIQIGIIFSKIV